MKWISEEDLKKHIIRDNCDEGCGYIDERDIIDMEWVEDDKLIPLSVIGSVLDKIRAEFISLYPKNYAGELELGGISCVFSLNKVLNIIDKYKAEGSE